MINCFQSSTRRFYYFFLFLNLACLVGYAFFERYQTVFFWILVFLLDASMLRNFFSKKNIRRVCINPELQEIEIFNCFFKPFGESRIYQFDEISYTYRNEQIGRLTKGKVIKLMSKTGNLIGIMTPELLFWKEEKLNLLSQNLESYISN